MENRTILEIFLLTGFIVSSCGWIYVHYKYVFKPMREENKTLHDKLVKERELMDIFNSFKENDLNRILKICLENVNFESVMIFRAKFLIWYLEDKSKINQQESFFLKMYLDKYRVEYVKFQDSFSHEKSKKAFVKWLKEHIELTKKISVVGKLERG